METSGYHVGIILDGNGRWATGRGKPRLFGHTAGFKNVLSIIKSCPECGVHTLTLYAFAIANWKRDRKEVDGLWDIFRYFFDTEVQKMQENEVRLRMIGNRDGVPEDVRALIEKAETNSKDNTRVVVQIALNYDGVDEVVRATRGIATEVKQGRLKPEDIDQVLIEHSLDTAATCPPDIIIRTGLPQVESDSGMALWRSSSFLQLQSAQAVCVSTPVLWPDFSKNDLQAAIAFAKPDERLFGGQRSSKTFHLERE